MSDCLQAHGLQPARLLCPWHFLGMNTGMGSHFFLLGIFLAQGLNLHLLHCRGFPRGLEGKASACNAGDPGSIPGLGKFPGEGHGNPL